MRRIVLHIDRLLLRGIGPGDAEAFSAALQAELHRQLATEGGQALLRQDRQARYRPAPVRVAAQTSNEQLGRAVAHQLVPATERGAP